jgi:hypothetical protein
MDDVTTLELDQLNEQRAVLRDGNGTTVTISRGRWEELGRRTALVMRLDADQ